MVRALVDKIEISTLTNCGSTYVLSYTILNHTYIRDEPAGLVVVVVNPIGHKLARNTAKF